MSEHFLREQDRPQSEHWHTYTTSTHNEYKFSKNIEQNGLNLFVFLLSISEIIIRRWQAEKLVIKNENTWKSLRKWLAFDRPNLNEAKWKKIRTTNATTICSHSHKSISFVWLWSSFCQYVAHTDYVLHASSASLFLSLILVWISRIFCVRAHLHFMSMCLVWQINRKFFIRSHTECRNYNVHHYIC